MNVSATFWIFNLFFLCPQAASSYAIYTLYTAHRGFKILYNWNKITLRAYTFIYAYIKVQIPEFHKHEF